MKLMLDTNIYIYIIKQKPAAVLKRFLKCQMSEKRQCLPQVAAGIVLLYYLTI